MEAAETLDSGDTVVGDYDPFGDAAPTFETVPAVDEFAPPEQTTTKKKKKKKKQDAEFVPPASITDESLRARERELARREAGMLEAEHQAIGGYGSLSEGERRAKEEELYRKEKELLERERLISQAESLARPKNWPKCWPLIYHDIATEIPDPERKSITRRLYFSWMITTAAYLWNFIAVLSGLLSGALAKSFGANVQTAQATMSMIYALLYGLLGIPLCWMMWYYRMYKYMKTPKVTTRYYAFFIFFGANVVFNLALSLGLFDGAAGGGTMIQLLTCASGQCADGTKVSPNDANAMSLIGVFYAISMGMWIVNVLFGALMFRVTWKFFKQNFGKEGEVLDDETRQAAIIAAQAARAI